MHVAFTQQMGVHSDLELQEYVQRVGEKLAAVSEMPGLDWHFTIVDTDDVNAFATMGGYVYISRGILPYFQNEADLAAVLGHEIGHITAEHLKKQQRKGMISGLASAATAIFTGMPALADLTNMAGQAIISGYGRDAELEADRLGASYLAKSGYDPEAMIRVIATLKAQDTFERERARLEGREPRLYHGVFASHPDNDTRLQQAVASAGRSPALGAGGTNNPEGFLRAIEGLPVGSSARQGMVRENRFYHSDMQFTLAFPRGWQVMNEPDKILAIAPKKEHYLEIRTQAPPADLTDPREFAQRGLGNKRLSHAESLDVNGLKAWTAIVRGDPSPYGQSTQRALLHHLLRKPDVGLQGREPLGRRDAGGRCLLPLDRQHVPAHARQRVPARRAEPPARDARGRRHDHRIPREGQPHQAVPAAAAAADQQPLPGRRAEARRPRQDRQVKGTLTSSLTIPRPSFSPPAPPAPARDGSRGFSRLRASRRP